MTQEKTANMSLKKTGTLFIVVFAFYGNALMGNDLVSAVQEKLTTLRSVNIKDTFKMPYTLNAPKFPSLGINKEDELEIYQLDASAAVCASATWASMKGIGLVWSACSSWRWNRALRNQILPEEKPGLGRTEGTVMDLHKFVSNPEVLCEKVKKQCESVVAEQTVSVEKYNKQIKAHNNFVVKVMKKSPGLKKALARKLPFLSAIGVYCLVSSCVNHTKEPQGAVGSEKAL